MADSRYFFKPGNKYGRLGGKPPKGKSQIETIRNRILRVVKRRVMHETDLNSVTTTDLLKFLATIMPKDVGISVQAPQINYISNIPREEESKLITGTITPEVVSDVVNPIEDITNPPATPEVLIEPTVP